MIRGWRQGAMTALLAGALAMAAGCGGGDNTPPGNDGAAVPTPGNSENSSGGTPPVETPNPTVTLKIKTYYSDKQLQQLHELDGQISFNSEDLKYLTALQTLQGSPAGDYLSLFRSTTFRSAAFAAGQVTVDLELDKESQLGAGGEEMYLRALENTLFQFAEVTSIQILLDGKQVETLMGHVSLSHPIKRTNG